MCLQHPTYQTESFLCMTLCRISSEGASLLGALSWAILSPELHADRLQECLACLKKSWKMPLVFHGGIQESCFRPFGLDIVAAQQTLRYEGKDGDLPPAMCSLSASRGAGLKTQTPLRKDKHGFDPSLCQCLVQAVSLSHTVQPRVPIALWIFWL